MVEAPPSLKQQEVRPLQDHCGVMGIFYPDREGTYIGEMRDKLRDEHEFPFMRLQTRGYDGAGFWSRALDGTTSQHKARGSINEALNRDVLNQYADTPGKMFVLQTRYGTKGSASAENVQPLIGSHHESGDEIAVAHNGQFSLDHEGAEDNEESDTVQYHRELLRSEGDNWNDRIVSSLVQKRGAYSLIIGTPDGLYLARDRKGFRPLSYGRRPDGAWVAASESAALEMEGITDLREVMPGEVVQIDDKGPKTVHEFETDGDMAACSFEDVYIADGRTKLHVGREAPDRINHAITTDKMRRNSGRELAREAPVEMDEWGLVVGVPGTAIPGGEEYAKTLGLTYRQIIKDREPNNQRSFMSENIDEIYHDLLNHFNFDAKSIKGRDITLVDDSIVRGNVSSVLAKLLREVYGAKNIHFRVLSPPIDKECFLGISTRSKEELVAAKFENDVDAIADYLGVDSLGYLSVGGLRKSITGSRTGNGLCTGCMAGEQYPMDRYGNTIPHMSNPGQSMRLFTGASA
jgi:amidophosphoribosyltransferase